MTVVDDSSVLSVEPVIYSDFPFHDHIFNDRDKIIGYRSGGVLESLVFDFIADGLANVRNNTFL